MCWMEIEAFRGVPVSDKAIRNIQAKQLKSRYLNKTYLFGPNSPVTKEAQRQVQLIILNANSDYHLCSCDVTLSLLVTLCTQNVP